MSKPPRKSFLSFLHETRAYSTIKHTMSHCWTEKLWGFPGKKLPPSFDAVSKYFVSVHNYTAETNACNICILPEMRRKGIGEFMLSNLIIMAGNSNITLTVLKSNTAAINLYQKHGFRMLYEFDDYGGYGRPTVKSYKMILLNSDV